jgi:hypothetical protein
VLDLGDVDPDIFETSRASTTWPENYSDVVHSCVKWTTRNNKKKIVELSPFEYYNFERCMDANLSLKYEFVNKIGPNKGETFRYEITFVGNGPGASALQRNTTTGTLRPMYRTMRSNSSRSRSPGPRLLDVAPPPPPRSRHSQLRMERHHADRQFADNNDSFPAGDGLPALPAPAPVPDNQGVWAAPADEQARTVIN